MRKHDLQFILTTAEIQGFLYPSFYKTAQDAVPTGIVSTIQNYVSKNIHELSSVEGVLSFIGPGLLWMFGFRKFAVAYELAKALGFNWDHFFSSIKDAIAPILHSSKEGNHHDASEIQQIVQSVTEQSFTDHPDEEKIKELVTTQSLHIREIMKFGRSRYDKSEWYEFGNKFMDSWNKSHGAPGTTSRNVLIKFISKFFYWILLVFLISCGFAIGGSVISSIVSGLFGKKDKSESTTSNTSSSDSADEKIDSHSAPLPKSNVKLILNQDADSKLFQTTYNDNNHVWLLHLNIHNIKPSLIAWAQALYPQLIDESAFEQSTNFQKTIQMFEDKNKIADQLEILAVPHPFQSIKDVVDNFAFEVASNMQKNQSNHPNPNNTPNSSPHSWDT